MATAVLFNSVNGYLHGRWYFTLGQEYSINWFFSPQFIIGLAIFIGGMAINLHSDHILRNLRKTGEKETEYKIPYGGVFRWVSCGNYFGEVTEWIGWAVLTWSLPGLVFALWVMANLVPRARSHHKWYHEKFPDYPPERKAIFPFLF
jgi:3-oxo-5-alpha-steroid 4-dehydrogenase 1